MTEEIKRMVNDTGLKDWLNPKAVVATGGSAAMVLAFTTTLTQAFPQLPPAMVALALSAVFAALQVSYLEEKVLRKIVYVLVCTLVIFHTARGGNGTLADAVNPTPEAAPLMLKQETSAEWSLVPSAHADSVNTNAEWTLEYVTDRIAVYTNSTGTARKTNWLERASQRIIIRRW